MKEKKEIKKMIIDASLKYGLDGDYEDDTVCLLPYKDKNLVERVLREIWFRLKLPNEFWYNKSILKYSPHEIVVYDPLITVSFLKWLSENKPNSIISYCYNNLVGKAKNLHPNQVPKNVLLVTYDSGDSEKYGMTLKTGHEFPKSFIKEKLPIEYDVIYVGADKGRGDYICDLEVKMKEMGLRTKFIITKDGRLSKKKKYYSKTIPYTEVIDMDRRTKAILNIALPGQVGLTKRDFESVYLKCKLITNNKKIKESDIYNPNNVFVLGEDDLSTLKSFIGLEYIEPDEHVWNNHLRV